MDANEIIGLLYNLNISKKEFTILSSAALVLRGILPDAGDIDIAVTEEGLRQLKNNYNLKKKDDNSSWYITKIN